MLNDDLPLMERLKRTKRLVRGRLERKKLVLHKNNKLIYQSANTCCSTRGCNVVEMIAFCGINCSECKALIATQRDDDTMRIEIAKEWSKDFGHEIKPEEINCEGCLIREGRHINYCNVCEIRKCGIEKDVKNCAYCIDYKCEKLAKFHEQASKAKNGLEEIRKQMNKK